MANQLDFGRFVERLMRDAEANFPLLAPIRIGRDVGRDVWRVQTRRGEFQVSEHAIPVGRRHLVEFFVYQLQQLQRRAESDDQRGRRIRADGTMDLRVGDRITVNGRETQIVAIHEGCLTVAHLDVYQVPGRCNCPACRERMIGQQVADAAYDARRYIDQQDAARRAAMFGEFLPPPIPPQIAEARSIELLRRQLTPAQLEQWDREQAIEVRGGDTGIRYRIRGQITSFNIDRLEGNRGRLCCTPGWPGDLPLGDYVLGQKLALELDEERFLREANIQYDPREDARVPRGVVATQADLDRLFRDTYINAAGL